MAELVHFSRTDQHIAIMQILIKYLHTSFLKLNSNFSVKTPQTRPIIELVCKTFNKLMRKLGSELIKSLFRRTNREK